MMTDKTSFQTQIDGRTATAEELSALAFAGFAHFTAMQVRGGAVRGLDLHLARLNSASTEFFGQAMSDEVVRERLRAAIGKGPSDVSLTATMFSRTGEFTRSGAQNDPAVLVRTGPAFDGPKGPLRLAAVEHERPLPAIKHVGEATKTHYLRRAVRDGYDDAAFVDSRGHLSEATIWNLVFWDGESVVWPKAALLAGVTMGILRRQLESLNIPQREETVSLDHLSELRGAAVMNSWTSGVPVNAIASVPVPTSPMFMEILRQAYEREPLESV
jgi:branched-subunit amino acid aminotransferase/4-amino-4-deoxychorismate lyase